MFLSNEAGSGDADRLRYCKAVETRKAHREKERRGNTRSVCSKRTFTVCPSSVEYHLVELLQGQEVFDSLLYSISHRKWSWCRC